MTEKNTKKLKETVETRQPLKNIENFLESNEPENYNFENEWGIKEYNDLETVFDRYFTYKVVALNLGRENEDFAEEYKQGKEFAMGLTGGENEDKYRNIVDPDGAGAKSKDNLIHEVYNKLWKWEKEGKNTFRSIESGNFSIKFGPDTMNSAQNVLNSIVQNIIENSAEDSFEHKTLRAKKRPSYRYSLKYMLELYGDKNTKNKFISLLESQEELKKYISIYHTIGNFCLVPEGFNAGRANQTKDYWDRSLRILLDEGWPKKANVKIGGTFNQGESDAKDFERYINYFFLWDYIEEKGIDKGRPITLIDDVEGKNKEDVERFLETAIRFIERRGIFMVAMLRLQQELGEAKYDELRKAVFLKDDEIYANFEEVFNKIKKQLKSEIETNNKIDIILLNAKNEINKI